jgi:prepilin-type N-terminal cleavage/methylation domain-containing protein
MIMTIKRLPSAAPRRREAGFTLAEMLVALAVTSILLLAVLATFDLNTRVARVQTNVADMQQSLRVAQDQIVRTVRMAGRGSLPLADASAFPEGVAIALRNNVADNQILVSTEPATRILPGTDVLTVRGVFGTLYQINSAASVTYDDKDNPTRGTLTVLNITPSGATQDLTPLKNAISIIKNGVTGVPEAILLSGAADDGIHAIVELVPGASTVETDKVVLSFKITGGRADAFGKLSTGGAFPRTSLQNISFAGIVEEYRFYVREEHAVTGDRSSDLTPKLARARFFPGTDDPYNGEPSMDLADNILDLQVAFVFDSTIGGRRSDDLDDVGADDQILETADGTNDDWLFNAAADKPDDAAWQGPPRPPFQYVRVTTVARTDRRDAQYQAPLLTRSEDRFYATTDPAMNVYSERMYRRRSLRTVIDVRNL